MIWESCYWKDDLLKTVEDLRKRKLQRRWSEVSRARVEQSVMIGFYSVRKLIEAKKISDAISSRSVALCSFQPTGKHVTLRNWHRIYELYDLDRRAVEHMKVFDLANQFIHSYVFTLVFGEKGGLESILFCSDRRRSKALYMVTIDCLVEIFTQIGEDYPNSIHSVWQEGLKDYRVCSETLRGIDPVSGFDYG